MNETIASDTELEQLFDTITECKFVNQIDLFQNHDKSTEFSLDIYRKENNEIFIISRESNKKEELDQVLEEVFETSERYTYYSIIRMHYETIITIEQQ